MPTPAKRKQKSLGQIAYEARSRINLGMIASTPWLELPSMHVWEWEVVARAVARAVQRRAKVPR